MTIPLYALIGFVFWTGLLVAAIGSLRIFQVATSTQSPNGFDSGTRHGSDPYWRLNRAHMNCVENLPLFAAVVLVGAAIGAASDTMDWLARIYMIARVGQSLAHIASGSVLAVKIRFTFFCVQMVSLLWFGCLLVF